MLPLEDASADVFLPNYAVEPTAVDVSITHPLAPSLSLSLQAAKQALCSKAGRKRAKYASLVAERKLNLVPFILSTFGALEEEQAMPFLDKVAGF